MSKRKEKGVIPIWQWLLIMILSTLPCVGIPLAAVGAFVGENETRKNYFRAILILYLLAVVLWMILMAAGLWPHVQARISALWR